MDKKVINDIADKLQGIKNDNLLTEGRYAELPIDKLILQLKEEKKRGAKFVRCDGTLLTDRFNSVMMTNRSQM